MSLTTEMTAFIVNYIVIFCSVGILYSEVIIDFAYSYCVSSLLPVAKKALLNKQGFLKGQRF
jgi:hypothetical protein